MTFEDAKKFLADKGLVPFISFKDGEAHEVELVKCKRDTITNNQGEVIDGVKWLVKEDDTPKTFFTSSPALVNRLAEYSVGDIIKIRLKKVKTDAGFRSSYEVELVKNAEKKDKGPEEEIKIEELGF